VGETAGTTLLLRNRFSGKPVRGFPLFFEEQNRPCVTFEKNSSRVPLWEDLASLGFFFLSFKIAVAAMRKERRIFKKVPLPAQKPP